jgi:hypothetical protein
VNSFRLKIIGSLARRAGVWIAVAVLLPAVALAGGAEEPATSAGTPAIYAAFTLNLMRFVTWPENAFASPTEPFVIGTFRGDPINDKLDAAVARGELVNDRPVRTIRIQSPDEAAKCHVVFLSRNSARQRTLLRGLAHKPVLTIGDAEGFLENGGHVRFVPQPSRVVLRISVENLKASGLECRAQLLRLAAEP